MCIAFEHDLAMKKMSQRCHGWDCCFLGQDQPSDVMCLPKAITVCNYKYLKVNKSTTLRLHYNAVLYNADSIITRSPRGSQIFFQYKCQQTIAVLHNASCENRTPCVFPSQVWHQLIFPWGSVNGSLNIQCLRNGWSCVIERRLSNFCLQNKTVGARGKRDNDG